ncbi:HET-domain-containing protein, partial [Pleomassaria siparia CBS 279.74]
MATKTTTRLYRTLNPGEIRLVTLLPGSSDEIKCKLSHSNLVEKEKFEALSYAWGHSSLPRKSITVDGIQVPVGPNLWDALHHFRLCSHSKEKVLWIDALCINQSDDLEKGVQIQKMRDVYGTASRVLIWLGKASVNSDLAMRFVDRFVNVDIEAPNVDAWTALQELFQRAWWTRSWVLQEV